MASMALLIKKHKQNFQEERYKYRRMGLEIARGIFGRNTMSRFPRGQMLCGVFQFKPRFRLRGINAQYVVSKCFASNP